MLNVGVPFSHRRVVRFRHGSLLAPEGSRSKLPDLFERFGIPPACRGDWVAHAADAVSGKHDASDGFGSDIAPRARAPPIRGGEAGAGGRFSARDAVSEPEMGLAV